MYPQRRQGVVFADRSERIAPREAFKGYGVAVTPGADGPCALVAGYGHANRLYTYDGDRFRDVTPSALAAPDHHAVGVAAGDVDADGREELYVHDTDAYEGETHDTDLLLDPVDAPADDPESRWRDLFGLGINAGRDNFRAGRSVAVVDRYGTGRYGVAVASHGEPLRFYEVGEDGELSDMAEEVGLSVADRGRCLLAGSIVSDRTDLFVGVQEGPNRLFRNDGGHFTEVAAQVGLAAPETNARGVTRADEALVLCSWEGPNCVFSPSGDAATGGVDVAPTGDDDQESVDGGPAVSSAPTGQPDGGGFVDRTPAALAEPSRVRTVVAADFDNDGHDEVFVNCLGRRNRLFRWHPDREPTRWEALDPGAAADPDGLGTGAAVADFDGDGVLELLVSHGEVEPQPPALYAPLSAGDRWLRVAPTTRHGAPARGATVTLETDRWDRRRTVCGGSGYLCQMEPVAHFGLGEATPRRVTVRWPDGRTETLTDPGVARELRVEHPGGDAA